MSKGTEAESVFGVIGNEESEDTWSTWEGGGGGGCRALYDGRGGVSNLNCAGNRAEEEGEEVGDSDDRDLMGGDSWCWNGGGGGKGGE